MRRLPFHPEDGRGPKSITLTPEMAKHNSRGFDKNSGQKSNEYHLDGLIKEAISYAKEMIDAQKQRREEAASRRIRKRPKLEAVKDK